MGSSHRGKVRYKFDAAQDNPLTAHARLLVFLYKGSYPETDVSVCGIRQFSKIEDTFTGAGKQEFLHAQMYALAAKLNIPELFDIAHRAFKQRYIHSTHFSRKDWPDLVEYIYTSTASADKHLRISILYGMRLAISSDHQQVHDANLALVLKTIPDFAFDLITTEVSGKDSTCCPECSTYQQVLNERCAHGWSMDCTKGCWEDCLRKTECRYCDRVGLQNC